MQMFDRTAKVNTDYSALSYFGKEYIVNVMESFIK